VRALVDRRARAVAEPPPHFPIAGTAAVDVRRLVAASVHGWWGPEDLCSGFLFF